MALQSLILPIISLFRSAGINQAANALKGLGGQFNSLSGQIGAAAASFAGFQALSTARIFTNESVAAANLFERNLLGLNQVFEELQPRIVGFTKDVENYGLSQSQAAQASVFLGSVLKQYGFTTLETATQTEKLVKLSQDLATTYGYDVSEALLAVTALFRGEYDPIEKFGVAMKQNEVNARLAAQGLNDLEGAELANAQAIARLEMLFERASDSTGAFSRATDTLYGSQQKLNAALGNLQLAAGEPLQKPLANINNLFAEVVQELGPQIVQIYEALGNAIDVVGPSFAKLGELVLQILGPLEQLIDLLSFVLAPIITLIVNPALDILADIFGFINSVLDNLTANLDLIALGFRQLGAEIEKSPFKPLLDAIKWLLDNGYGLGALLDFLGDSLDQQTNAARAAAGEFDSYNGSAKQASVAARASAYAARDAAKEANKFESALKGIATGSTNAEGKLTGLAGVFQNIQDEIDKSKAKTSMEELGLSAAFIEEALTRPNWKEIFEVISTYAKLAAIDVAKIGNAVAVTTLLGEKAQLEKRLNELFKASDPKDTGKKTGQSFFAGLNDEIAKQTATSKLKAMGASEGLVQAILGTENWEATYKRIVAMGPAGLEKLQQKFNQTAEGVRELADAAKEAQDKFDELYEGAIDAANEYIKTQQKLADDAKADFERIEDAAKRYKETISDFASIEILPNIEVELGRFEQAVVSSVDRIRAELKQAFRQDLIYKSDFDNISAFVSAEESALIKIAKQRDAMAKKLSLSETLIGEYQRALTGALQLTSLFSKLKGETEKRTVTEIQRGVVALGRSLREFEVTVTRSYEEPIQMVQDKTQGLLQGFRDMAAKSRDFAENLRRLKALGLDPMLFNQLVQAGAEAGGETAQGIVDGGQAAVNELNTIFDELNKLGAELGMDVGMTMYEAGKDMTYGLLEGIKSEQERLLQLARSMAEAFSREFQSRLTIAVDAPVRAAEAARDAAQAAVPDIKQIDVEALGKITKLIENARIWLNKNLSVFERIRSEDILEIYEGLRQDILNFVPLDLSGIRAGMSVEDLAMAARSAGGQTINNFYLDVTADSRTSASKAGEEIVNKLESFTRANGGSGGGLLAQVL